MGFLGPDKDKIRAAFANLDKHINNLPVAKDPHVIALLNFICELKIAFK